MPELRPPLRRDRIDEAIAVLEQAAAAKTIPARRYRAARKWLDSNRFYLLPDDCDRVNELLPTLDNRLREQESSSVSLNIPAFVSHPQMDPALYYERP